MTTASISVQRSGNVLDLNAYRQQREEALALRRAEEDAAWMDWCEEADPETFSAPAPRSSRREHRIGEVMDVAASAAMVLTAVIMTAVVLL